MKKISEMKELFQAACEDELPELIKEYEKDERAGVRRLAELAKKQLNGLLLERQRIEGLKLYEKQYGEYEYICGIDEAGRGPLAGPVVAGAVILPKDCSILYINDSKKLTEKKREELYKVITEQAVAWAVGTASPERIDEINILNATYEAMRQAVLGLSVRPDILLNDAVRIPLVEIPQVPIIKGDAKSISIGAASIIAKVTRDRMMKEYSSEFPEYDFGANKGYGSAAHIEALKKYGPSPIHRRSFIKNFTENGEENEADTAFCRGKADRGNRKAGQ